MKLAEYVNEINELIKVIPREDLVKTRDFFNTNVVHITDPRKTFVWYVIRTCFRITNYSIYDRVRAEVPGTNDSHWYTLFNYVLRVYHHL